MHSDRQIQWLSDILDINTSDFKVACPCFTVRYYKAFSVVKDQHFLSYYESYIYYWHAFVANIFPDHSATSVFF